MAQYISFILFTAQPYAVDLSEYVCQNPHSDQKECVMTFKSMLFYILNRLNRFNIKKKKKNKKNKK